MALQSLWFETLSPAHEGSLRLFCFPYAGGSAHVYRTWQHHFRGHVSLSLVHLPGRAKRINEPPFTELKPLVETLADALVESDNRVDYAFWGHSMGALISFELARELRRRELVLPRALFVSGRGAPHYPLAESPTFNLPDEEFVTELRRLNGTPGELLESAESLKLFLPTTRADFQIVDTYLYQHEAPLACAIYAYGGLQDADVSAESLSAWQEQTTSGFKARMFPGDHFFIHRSTGTLVNALRRDLLDVKSLRSQST